MQELSFTIPVHEPLPSQYVIRVPSDKWMESVSQTSISLQNIVLPELHPIQTGNFLLENYVFFSSLFFILFIR